MRRQRTTLIVLFVFVAGLVATSAGDLLHASEYSEQLNHSEGSSCPDPGDGGNPCGPACPCACCPGHSRAVPFGTTRPCIQAPSTGEIQVPVPDDLHPKDVTFRIFHPPRA